MPDLNLKIIPPDVKTQPSVRMCHRFMIPTPNTAQMNFVPCIKGNCMRWDVNSTDCKDNVDTSARELIALYLESLKDTAEKELSSIEVD